MALASPLFTPALASFDEFVTRDGILEPDELESIACDLAARPDVWGPLGP